MGCISILVPILLTLEKNILRGAGAEFSAVDNNKCGIFNVANIVTLVYVQLMSAIP